MTPRFPEGLSTWQASGQWRSASGQIIREPSYVLSLVHPDDPVPNKAIQEIITSYKYTLPAGSGASRQNHCMQHVLICAVLRGLFVWGRRSRLVVFVHAEPVDSVGSIAAPVFRPMRSGVPEGS